MRKLANLTTIAVFLALTPTATTAVPIPIGEADVTFSYMTTSGLRILEGQYDYSGEGPADVVPLDGDPNLGYFNSVNTFGRRILVDGAVYEDESLLTHSFFKAPGHADDFFADIVEGAWLTLEVQNIHFAEPVLLQEDTVMLHKNWDADQVDQLPDFYINVHNHDTGTGPFRDFEDFFPLVFMDFPINFELGALSGDSAIEIFGQGTDTLGFRITFPYDRFRHFEDVDQEVPPGLPAPFGYLEPFHFHLEFVVAPIPEPATALILLGGLLHGLRRRRRDRL